MATDPTVVALLLSGLGAMAAAVVAQWRLQQSHLREMVQAQTEHAESLKALQTEMRRLTDAVTHLVTLVDERTERRQAGEPLRFPERRTATSRGGD